ncbi:hypothetical protein Tco_0355348 [Tanacetum coccineum]
MIASKFRMCVDFTDINKACQKDCYSLPEIDWKVDSLSDYKIKCLLNAYKGYHHIKKAKVDEHKTTLHAPKGDLKMSDSKPSKVVDKVFTSQIGRNMESYIDDMEIKSMDEENMLLDIKETFKRLRGISMKLNLKKCSFKMEEGQFLGHVVSKQGIKANPAMVQALMNLELQNTIKEVQSLNGLQSCARNLDFFESLTCEYAVINSSLLKSFNFNTSSLQEGRAVSE